MIVGKPTSKKEKKKFNKNSSFSGVGTKKSPESRRKSIAAVLPTPLKKKKKVENVNEWTVTDTARRKQLIVTDNSEEFIDVVVNTSVDIETPKKKKSKITSNLDELKIIESASPIKISKILSKKKKTQKESVKEVINNDDANEAKFGIKESEVIKAIKGAIKLHRENPKLQNQLFDERIPLNLQISCHIVPNGPRRIIRIPLPNSPLTPDDEICLIVPEVKGIKNIEHEKHVEHYEDLLRRKGVDNIKKIMTFHEFRTEYETFEQKLKLVDLYDVFLADGRISGKVVNKCGKIFYKKRKVPTAVKLQATKLKEQIDNALSKAFFSLHLKGDSYSVQFGHDKMEIQDLAENVFAIIERLDKEFPGGFNNFKGVHVSALRSTSVPIYLSFKNPRDVKSVNVKSKKPKAFKTYEGELTTLLNADVVVEPSGKVLVKRTKIEEDDKDEDVEHTNVETEKNTSENQNTTKKTKKRKQRNNETEDVASTNVEIEDNTNKNENVEKKTKKRKQKSIETEDVDHVNVEAKENLGENENIGKKTKKRKSVKKQNEAVEVTVETEEKTTKIKKRKQIDEKKSHKKNRTESGKNKKVKKISIN